MCSECHLYTLYYDSQSCSVYGVQYRVLTVVAVGPVWLRLWVAVLRTLVVSQVQHQNLLTDAHLLVVGGHGSHGLSCRHGLLLRGLLNVASDSINAAHVSGFTAVDFSDQPAQW